LLSEKRFGDRIYEVFVTAPFYTSLAYTLGWTTKRVLKKAY
jgi:hypothetical protein